MLQSQTSGAMCLLASDLTFTYSLCSLQRCFQQSERKSFVLGFFPPSYRAKRAAGSFSCHTLYIKDWKPSQMILLSPGIIQDVSQFNSSHDLNQCLMRILLIEEVHILQMSAVKSFLNVKQTVYIVNGIFIKQNKVTIKIKHLNQISI